MRNITCHLTWNSLRSQLTASTGLVVGPVAAHGASCLDMLELLAFQITQVTSCR